MTDEDVKKAFSDAASLQARVLATCAVIRERTMAEPWWPDLSAARSFALAGVWAAVDVKDGEPANADTQTMTRLQLIAALVQGSSVVETLIVEGQYLKATAALKQDFEFLARVGEVAANKARPGKTPDAKAGPPGTARWYGDLNKIAHPSREDLMTQFLATISDGEVQAVSHHATFHAAASLGLYEMHVWFLLQGLHALLGSQKKLYPMAPTDTWKQATMCLELGVTLFQKINTSSHPGQL